MTPLDVKIGQRYKYTKQQIQDCPWLALGVYTRFDTYSTYESVEGQHVEDVFVTLRGGSHCDLEVEIVE